MLTLLKHPDPFLDRQVPDFDFENPVVDPVQLELQMIALMVQENGIGLAATQVGVDARVFVIKTQLLEDVLVPFAVFNPEVLSISEDMAVDYEGCLSFLKLAAGR